MVIKNHTRLKRWESEEGRSLCWGGSMSGMVKLSGAVTHSAEFNHTRWKEPGELPKIRKQRKDAEDVNPLRKVENAEVTDIATAS
jgi:hypothetical protein